MAKKREKKTAVAKPIETEEYSPRQLRAVIERYQAPGGQGSGIRMEQLLTKARFF